MNDSKKKELLRFTGLMGFSGILSRLLSIPHSIVFAKFLMPSGLGILQIIKVIVSYFAYTQLGILQAMNRNVPRAYANNELDKVKKIKDLSYTWLFFVTLLALVVLWIVYFLKESLRDQLTLIEMILLTLVIIFGRINAFIKPLLKAEGKFIIIGKALLYKSLIAPIVGMVLVYYLNLYGAIMALAFDQLFQTVISLFLYREYIPRFYFNTKLFLNQISKGFLIYLNRFSETIISSLTILLIGIYYTTTEVGVFAFGMVSLVNVQRYSVPLRIYIYRDIMNMKGTENRNHKYYHKLFKLPNLFNMLFNTILLSVFATVFFTIINLFLPKYIESIPVMYISVLALIFYNSRVFYGQYMDATNQLIMRTILIFIGAGIGVLLSFFFLINQYPILYLAISCGVGFILISSSMILYVNKQLYGSFWKTISILLKMIVIASINCGLVYVYSKYNFISLKEDISFEQIALSLIDLSVKLLIILILNYGLFSVLFHSINFRKEMNKVLIFLLQRIRLIPVKKS